MADIFLSYARQERNDVVPIKVFVEKLGLSIFIDVEGLDAGEEFPARLHKEIEQAKLVLACWSPLALSRPWVRTECAAAKSLGKLFPIQIKPITEYDMVVAFSNINYMDMTDFLSATAVEKKRNFVGVLSRRLSEPDLLSTFERLSHAETKAAQPANAYEAELEIRLRQYREIFNVLKEREEIGAMETLLNEVTKFTPGMGLEILFRLDIDRLKAKAAPSAPSLSAPTEAASVQERIHSAEALAKASEQVAPEQVGNREAATVPNTPISRQRVRKMMQLSRSVCQIWNADPLNSFGMATGFVVEGDLLHPSWAGEAVLVTANHVISASARHPSKLPAACFARFPDDDKGHVDLALGHMLYESDPNQHDVSVLRLQGTPPSSSLALSEISEAPLPERGDDDAGIGRVSVIGFPHESELSFSLADNTLLDHDADVQARGEPVRLHYQAPTVRGSSGSPIFDGLSLQLVGIHHASSPSLRRLKPRSGYYPANEGISIIGIREDIRRRLG